MTSHAQSVFSKDFQTSHPAWISLCNSLCVATHPSSKLTHHSQQASLGCWPVRTLKTEWLTAAGSLWDGKALLHCVWGRHRGLTTVFRVRKLHPRAPSTHCFVHFAHGAKTDNYTIKSLNPRGPDLPSIACCCCIQIKILDQEPRSFVALLRHNLFLAIN